MTGAHATPPVLDEARRDELKRLAQEAKDALDADAQSIGLTTDRAALLSKVGLKLCGKFLRACQPETILALCAALEAGAADTRRIKWLEAHPTAYFAVDDDSVIVGVVHGGMNDRQYSDVGVGHSVRAALDNAESLAAARSPLTETTDG